VTSWNVPGLSNAAQRNVQTADLHFFVRNTFAENKASYLEIELDPAFPASGSFALLLQSNAIVGLPTPDATGNIVLNASGPVTRFPGSGTWTMNAISEIPSDVDYSLPAGSGPFDVVVHHYLDNQLVGGMTFVLRGGSVVK
jgi:hypothetical protein